MRVSQLFNTLVFTQQQEEQQEQQEVRVSELFNTLKSLLLHLCFVQNVMWKKSEPTFVSNSIEYNFIIKTTSFRIKKAGFSDQI